MSHSQDNCGHRFCQSVQSCFGLFKGSLYGPAINHVQTKKTKNYADNGGSEDLGLRALDEQAFAFDLGDGQSREVTFRLGAGRRR